MSLTTALWDAAIKVDPTAKSPEMRGLYGSAEALLNLWNGAGLTNIEVTDLTMQCQFSSFDELWQRYVSGSGSGPSGVYVAGLTENRREAVKQDCDRIFCAEAQTDRLHSRQKRGRCVVSYPSCYLTEFSIIVSPANDVSLSRSNDELIPRSLCR